MKTQVLPKINNDNDLLSDSSNASLSLSNQDASDDCNSGECSPHIIDHVLGNLTSDSAINITNDTILSSNIILTNLNNISLTGYNNPVIRCHKGAGLHILSSHNFAIEGITWDRCGTQYPGNSINPGIQFHFSSNITIRNCSFRHANGQALALFNLAGDMNINHCKFVSCFNSGGYGAAVYYSSSDPKIEFTISNCNFSHNNGTVSALYAGT